MKAIARLPANIKPTTAATMPVGGWPQLPIGGWVFGTVTATDITGFTYYYKPDGTKVELGKLSKCSLVNLYPPTNESENPTPDPEPTPTGTIYHWRKSTDGGKTFDAGIYLEVIE